MNSFISIIIPVKNGENYLAEALEGIKKQNMNVEIIVVDDASTDNTSQLAENFGCTVIKHDNCLGPVIAKNNALKIAHGDFIMFHDHDDIMNPNALKTLYNELETNLQISAVMAKVQDFYSPEMSEEEQRKTAIKKEPYWGLFTGAVLMRKSIFDYIGPFSESITAGEIIDWQARMQQFNLQIKKLDFVSTQRRIHTSNFGKTQVKKEFKDYARILRNKILYNVNAAEQIVENFRSTRFYNRRLEIPDDIHNENVMALLNNLDEEAYQACSDLLAKLEKAYKKLFVSVSDIYIYIWNWRK